nr:glycosyltransferase [Mycobacterium sp.]
MSDAPAPSVSVVVPTIGRPELLRALRSVRAQRTAARVELIVVQDGKPGIEWPTEIAGLADRVLRTSGGVGPSGARNLGIAAATGDMVALLDDDDEWLPNKLEAQLAVLRDATNPERTVVAGRQLFVNPRNGAVSRPGPDRLINHGEPVERYLFRRRPPSGGRPSIYPSALLCPRELAAATPWDDSLHLHEDWDWLIRLGRVHGTSFVQIPEPVVRIQLGSASSLSAGTDWHASLNWANRALRDDPAVYADFVVAQALRYALTARSWPGVRTVLAALRDANHLPSLGPVIIGVAGLLPRRVLERATVATGGVPTADLEVMWRRQQLRSVAQALAVRGGLVAAKAKVGVDRRPASLPGNDCST